MGWDSQFLDNSCHRCLVVVKSGEDVRDDEGRPEGQCKPDSPLKHNEYLPPGHQPSVHSQGD